MSDSKYIAKMHTFMIYYTCCKTPKINFKIANIRKFGENATPMPKINVRMLEPR
jgi:hypothetical protein